MTPLAIPACFAKACVVLSVINAAMMRKSEKLHKRQGLLHHLLYLRIFLGICLSLHSELRHHLFQGLNDFRFCLNKISL